MLNNKNVPKFSVLLWKIIVAFAEDSSKLHTIDKIMVSLVCTLGPLWGGTAPVELLWSAVLMPARGARNPWNPEWLCASKPFLI